jgi:non-canonical (house-cleaning) NTP pyrophosphatase
MSETSSDTNGDSPYEFVSDKESTDGQGQVQAKPQIAAQPPTPVQSPAVPELNVALKEQAESRPDPVPSQVEVKKPTILPMAEIKANLASTQTPSQSITVPAAGGAAHQRVGGDQPLEEVSLSPPKSPPSPIDGMLGWIASNSFLSKVAETAKNSVGTMITTLDPGMKEYLYSGGDVNVVVASDKDSKVVPIREAFIDVFGRATVKGVESQATTVAAQPVGHEAGLRAAEERIANIRTNQHISIPQNQVIVSLENFVTELASESWFELGCLVLEDPLLGVKLVVYTQAIPIPNESVTELKFETASDYPLRASGFSKTIGQTMAQKLDVPRDQWHEAWSGVSRGETIHLAARALASLYKNKYHAKRIQEKS